MKNAPSWEQLLHEFVLPHEDALWVGFNSLSCSGFKAQRTIEHLAGETVRSRYAIACALHKAGLMSLEAREQYARR